MDDVQRPTLADWTRPPGSRWAFRHVGELIPSVRVAASAPSLLEQAPVQGLTDLDLGEGRSLARFLEDSHADPSSCCPGGGSPSSGTRRE